MQGSHVSLNGYHSKGCVLFIFSASPQDNKYRIQMELFQDSQFAMDGRDLVLGEIFEQGNSHIGNDSISSEGSEYLRKQFHVLPGHFKVLLLGKDSRIKLLAETFVSSAELFLRLGTADMPRETAVF